MKKRWLLVIGIIIVLILLIIRIFVIANCSQSVKVTEMNSNVKEEISKMFSDETRKLIIYPSSRMIELEKGSRGSGFAFSVRNLDVNDTKYNYIVEVDPSFKIESRCNGTTEKEANSWIDNPEDEFRVPKSSVMDNPVLSTFTIPDSAPICTIPYVIKIIQIEYKRTNSTVLYVQDRINVVIKNKKTFLNKVELFIKDLTRGVTKGFLSC
jgi:hypothetical protein